MPNASKVAANYPQLVHKNLKHSNATATTKMHFQSNVYCKKKFFNEELSSWDSRVKYQTADLLEL